MVLSLSSFGVIPTTPLPIHTPLMPSQSIEVSLPLNTIGPVMKMDPLNNLQVNSYTVHSESIQIPSLFPSFVTLQPYSKIDKIFHQSTHNTP
jgi:hypothetical protein